MFLTLEVQDLILLQIYSKVVFYVNNVAFHMESIKVHFNSAIAKGRVLGLRPPPHTPQRDLFNLAHLIVIKSWLG